jgi:two-component SAPR family response regulator
MADCGFAEFDGRSLLLPQHCVSDFGIAKGERFVCEIINASSLRLTRPTQGRSAGEASAESSRDPAEWEINCFGAFAALRNGQHVEIGNSKARELTALLLLDRGRPMSKRRAAEYLWPDTETGRALDCLYKVLRNIKI